MITPEVSQAIKAHLAAGFAAMPIAWPNEPFERPVDPATKKMLPYVVVEIFSGGDEQASIGAPAENLFRSEGRLAVHVFVPKNTGDDVALQHCKVIRDLFRGQEITISGGMSIEFLDGAIPPGGDGDDQGLYWRRSVSIDFRFDETG